MWVHTTGSSKLDERTAIVRWVSYNANSTHARCVYWVEKGKVSVEHGIRFTAGFTTTTTISIPSPLPLQLTDKHSQYSPLAFVPSTRVRIAEHSNLYHVLSCASEESCQLCILVPPRL